MQQSEFSGDTLPDDALTAQISEILLSGDSPPSTVAFRLTGGTRDEVFHYIAAPHLVAKYLSDPHNNLGLQHYDHALNPLPGPVNLLLGEEHGQKISWNILARALAAEPAQSRLDANDIETMARKAAAKVIGEIKKNGSKNFNLMRDYGYLVPFMCAQTFTGAMPVSRASLGLRMFKTARNLVMRKHGRAGRLTLTDNNRSANEYLLWAHLMFGQIFANYGARNKVITAASSYASKRFSARMAETLGDVDSRAASDEAPNLAQRLVAAAPYFVKSGNGMTQSEYNHACKCILLEITASFHILVGISFGRILDVISQSGVSPAEYARALSAPGGERLLDRALAGKATTAMLYRTARRAFPEIGVKDGDIICFLVARAAKETCPAAILPKDFLLNLNSPAAEGSFLTFGPNEACPYHLSENAERVMAEPDAPQIAHPCFGQFWARAILKQMFVTLTDPELGWPDIHAVAGETARVSEFAKIPDTFIVTTKSGG